MCKGASKQSPDLKNYTAPGPRPPLLKFLYPPLTKSKEKKYAPITCTLVKKISNYYSVHVNTKNVKYYMNVTLAT